MRREDVFKRKKVCTSLDAKNYCAMGINMNASRRENQRVITINLSAKIELINFRVMLES